MVEDQFGTEIAELLNNFTPRSKAESTSMTESSAPNHPSSATSNSIEQVGAGPDTERSEALTTESLYNLSTSMNESSANVDNDIIYNEFTILDAMEW